MAMVTKKHPAICNWLTPFAEKGRKRGDKGEFWWELRACAYYNSFDSTKIIYNRFQAEPLFSLDDNSQLINDAPYFIPDSDNFLLGILNSKIYWFLITAMVTRLSGGYFQVHAKFMNRIPIPTSSKNLKEEIATLAKDCQNLAENRYEVENDLRLNIPDLCPEDREAKLNNKLKSWWLLSFNDFKKEIKKQFKHTMTSKETKAWRKDFDDDKTEIQSLSSQLATKEQELNAKVYKLFNLSEDEITLLEDNI